MVSDSTSLVWVGGSNEREKERENSIFCSRPKVCTHLVQQLTAFIAQIRQIMLASNGQQNFIREVIFFCFPCVVLHFVFSLLVLSSTLYFLGPRLFLIPLFSGSCKQTCTHTHLLFISFYLLFLPPIRSSVWSRMQSKVDVGRVNMSLSLTAS